MERVLVLETFLGLPNRLRIGEESADDLIEKLIASDVGPRHLVVVSSDHRLKTAARRKGAHALGCPEFLGFLDQRRHARVDAKLEEPAPQQNAQQHQLTEEEIHEWLQEFAGLEQEADLKEVWRHF